MVMPIFLGMKKITTLTAVMTITFNSYAGQATAGDERKCNTAINKTVAYLRERSELPIDIESLNKYSRTDAEQRIEISHRIIEQGEIIITHCDLNREMTEGIVDLIIGNKDMVERLSRPTATE
jgi:hypothetical protein